MDRGDPVPDRSPGEGEETVLYLYVVKTPDKRELEKGRKDRDTWMHMDPGVKTYTFRTSVE